MSIPGPGRYCALPITWTEEQGAWLASWLWRGPHRRAVFFSFQCLDGGRSIYGGAFSRHDISNLGGKIDRDLADIGLIKKSVPHPADTGNASGHASDIELHRLGVLRNALQCAVIGGTVPVLPAEKSADQA